jgi:hypothetical protein
MNQPGSKRLLQRGYTGDGAAGERSGPPLAKPVARRSVRFTSGKRNGYANPKQENTGSRKTDRPAPSGSSSRQIQNTPGRLRHRRPNRRGNRKRNGGLDWRQAAFWRSWRSHPAGGQEATSARLSSRRWRWRPVASGVQTRLDPGPGPSSENRTGAARRRRRCPPLSSTGAVDPGQLLRAARPLRREARRGVVGEGAGSGVAGVNRPVGCS